MSTGQVEVRFLPGDQIDAGVFTKAKGDPAFAKMAARLKPKKKHGSAGPPAGALVASKLCRFSTRGLRLEQQLGFIFAWQATSFVRQSLPPPRALLSDKGT